MNQIKLAIGVILVFLVGLLTGAIISGYYYKERVKSFETGGPPEGVKIRMLLDRFSHDLELTDSQKDKIEKVLRDLQENIFQLRRKAFPQIEEFNKKSLEQIKSILNSKQMEKFNTFQEKMEKFHDRFAARLDFPGKPHRFDINEIKDKLGLTPEQESEIKKIIDEGFQRREEIMKAERREDSPDFSEIRHNIMESENNQRKKIENILTTEQLEILKKYTGEKRPFRPPGPGPDSSGGPPPPPRW